MWLKILNELKEFNSGGFLGVEAIDVLHGSMWGLNIRYTTLNDAIGNKGICDAIFRYSISRLERLIDMPDISFKSREADKCGIGFGTYGWKYDHGIIEKAVEFGTQLIDTAEGYGFGKTEIELGKALKNVKKKTDVATKIRRDHMHPSALKAAVLRSIKKLGQIPHLQLHFPNDKYPDEVLGRCLVDLRRSKKILSIGLGNCSVDMIESMQRFLSNYSGDIIRSVQIEYSLLNRRIESFLLPYCQARGILVIAYSPLGQSYKNFKRLVLLNEIAKTKNCETAQVALAWLLSKKGVMPIPRTNNANHLKQNLEAEKIKLNQDEIIEIENHYPINIDSHAIFAE